MKKARLIKRSELLSTPRAAPPQPSAESIVRLSVVRVKEWVHERRKQPPPNPRAAFAALFAQPLAG